MASVPPKTAQMFRAILESIRDDFSGGRGWQSAAARMLGLHRSTVSKIYGDERGVTDEIVARVTERLGLADSYWTAVTGSSWKSHVVRRPLPPLGYADEYPDADARELCEALIAASHARRGLQTPELAQHLQTMMRALYRVGFLRRLHAAMSAGEEDTEPALRVALDIEKFAGDSVRVAMGLAGKVEANANLLARETAAALTRSVIEATAAKRRGSKPHG